ncbi:hypothetical protein C8F01DRAFT_1171713 [Mycena amicta]|nr:hypothetical protein C8F01DRAFT_1171713 [Mycena amicta]
MVSLPTELIELIIGNISDFRTLKSACLAASVCRRACQIRLHSSLDLGSPDDHRCRTYPEAAKHFGASPHLAGYVTALLIHLPSQAADNIIGAAAGRVLCRLTGVRTATIVGPSKNGPRWTELAPGVTTAVVDWLAWIPKLQQLTLWNVDQLPPPVLHRILVASKSLIVFDVSFEDATVSPLLAPAEHVSTGPERLSASGSGGIYALLVLPEFQQYTQSLRSLTMYFDHELEAEVCSLATGNLEGIELYFNELIESPHIRFPTCLPHVRDLLFTLSDFQLRWNVDWLPTVLDALLPERATPALTTITFRVRIYVSDASVSVYTLSAPLMENMDDLIVAHPALTAVYWVCDIILFVGHPNEDAPAHFAAFSGAVRRALPKALDKGLLSIEKGLAIAPRAPGLRGSI